MTAPHSDDAGGHAPKPPLGLRLALAAAILAAAVALAFTVLSPSFGVDSTLVYQGF